MPTIQRVLDLAQPACYLALNYREKGKLYNYGKPSGINQAFLIYGVYKILSKVYEEDPTHEGLQAVSDYLYELLQKFAFKAAAIVDGGGGGSVTPPSSLTRPEQLNFTVAASGTPLVDGQSATIFYDFIGWNLTVVKNSQPLDQIDTKPVYYTWNRDTGTFTTNLATITGDEWQLTPV